MLSMPPATIESASPARIAWAASMTALRPEPHTLLIVTAAMVSGKPALRAACRAGFWPTPAWMHIAHDDFVDLVRRVPWPGCSASAMATAPSCGAGSIGQAAEEFADGRAGRGEQEGVGHEIFLVLCGGQWHH